MPRSPFEYDEPRSETPLTPRQVTVLVTCPLNAAAAFGVAGDQDALRDSPRVLRVLGAVARDQYVVPFRARTGILGRRPALAWCNCWPTSRAAAILSRTAS